MTEQSLPFESRDSQAERILSFLLEGNRITPLEALSRFGSLRLGGRCFDLRKAGWNVQTEMVKRNGKRFAEYYIPKDRPKVT